MGGRDYWTGDALCLIEWPEKAQGYLPDADLIINIEYLDEARTIESIEK
jgi:tRNA threonylcarbamoyladenosine biosynthesis protein TsaE